MNLTTELPAKQLKLPAEPKPEDITVLRDTREQTPLSDKFPFRVEEATLPTGDFSIKGLSHVVAVEMKWNLADAIKIVGSDRERFDREAARLAAYPHRAMIVAASWGDLEMGQWRGNVTPKQAIGSYVGWIAGRLPIIMAGRPDRAELLLARFLYIAARRRWREARSLVQAVLEGGAE